MDTTGLQKLGSFSSLKLSRNSSIARSSYIEDHDNARYTSLKDIILSSPTYNNLTNQEGNIHEFGSSSISIRNELVKRAASAYLQSAAILASRNQSWFVGFGGKIKNKARTCSNWINDYIVMPLQACFSPIYRFLVYAVGGIRSRTTGIS